MRRKCDFEKVDITLWQKCFPENCLDFVTTYSSAFVLKFPQKSLDGQKSTVWKTVRMLSITCSCEFFCNFQQVWWWLYWNGLSICVFNNIMKNRAQLKERELRLLVLFLLIILGMRSSTTLECAASVCILKKLWV